MTLRKILACLVSFSAWGASALAANPYKMVIVSEPDAIKAAREFIELIKKTAPFSEMGNQLTFRIVRADPKKLGCHQGCNGIIRMACCNDEYAAELGARANAHKILITTTRASGGSGGSIAVMGKDYPPSILLHELLHTYYLGDEYEYSDIDAKVLCAPPLKNSNYVSIVPRPSYRSDSEAKEIHGNQIPWQGQIKNSTLITAGSSLGTLPRIYPAALAALYRGGACNKRIPTWKPYYDDNIMSRLDRIVIPPVHADTIVKIMSAERGETIRLIARDKGTSQSQSAQNKLKATSSSSVSDPASRSGRATQNSAE